MKAKIVTCNSVFEDWECVGGYSEVHDICDLSNKEHLIATIDSIIKNNLLYECEDTILEAVIIYCNDHRTVEYITEHCKDIFSIS